MISCSRKIGTKVFTKKFKKLNKAIPSMKNTQKRYLRAQEREHETIGRGEI